MRVVGLVAWCEFVPWDPDRASPGSVSFEVSELADLADGRRVVLHSGERGWSVSGPPVTDVDPLGGQTADDIKQGALMTVLPDDEDPAEDHPYEWLAAVLRARAVPVTADELRAVPYEVELGPVVTDLLRHAGRRA